MKPKNYFEGYYFKHTINNEVFAFIVSYHRSESGECYSMIQFINRSGSYTKRFDFKDFVKSPTGLDISIANHSFSEKGITADIMFDDFHLVCDIQYRDLIPLQAHIMGPFRFLPFMECHHDVYSLTHHLTGFISINNELLVLDGGVGYIEGDKGESFPEQYLWAQANFTEDNFNNSIMAAVATIPMLGFQFMGVIAEVYYQNKHYRFATYERVKLVKLTNTEAHLKQDNMLLKITQLNDHSHDLDAPTKGLMTHKIKESPACDVSYEFYHHDDLIFKKIISTSSFEAKNLNHDTI